MVIKMTAISMLPIIWLVMILASIFCEAAFENLVTVWFAPAAALALVCGWFDMAARGQVVLFLVSSVIMIASARIFKKIMGRKRKHIPRDSDIE